MSVKKVGSGRMNVLREINLLAREISLAFSASC